MSRLSRYTPKPGSTVGDAAVPLAGPFIALLAVLSLALQGCRDRTDAVLLRAEVADDNHNGIVDAGELLELSFDTALSHEISADELLIAASSGETLPCELQRREGQRLVFTISETRQPLRISGVFDPEHRSGDAAAAVSVLLTADDPPHWVDLDFSRSHPVLQRAVWKDAPPFDLVVNRGDIVELVFDRPVELRARDGAATVRRPVLRRPDEITFAGDLDRLDDGRVRTVLQQSGTDPMTVQAVLGSSPFFAVGETLMDAPDSGGDRQPSALVLGGSVVFPLTTIVNPRGGWGAVSSGPISIEADASLPRPRSLPGLRFPSPGDRRGHTVTPLSETRALVIGGEALATKSPLNQILLFDPRGPGRLRDLESDGVALPTGSIKHTATLLPGNDGIARSEDDLIVVIGGTNASQEALDTVLALQLEGRSVALAKFRGGAPPRLRVPRAEHAAVAVGPYSILIDGGNASGSRRSGLVGCAELIRFAPSKDRTLTVVEHSLVRSLPRIGHTLTLLPITPAGETFVLAYGGYGAPPQRDLSGRLPGNQDARLGEPVGSPAAADFFVDYAVRGAVLVSPVLFNIGDPTQSIRIELSPSTYHFAMPRSGHGAMLLEGHDNQPSRVVIAGGTSYHLSQGYGGGLSSWETPVDVLTERRGRSSPIPEPHDAGDAVVFHFAPEEPAASTFEILPNPSSDAAQVMPRTSPATVHVPGLGVLFLGGYSPPEGMPLAEAAVFVERVGTDPWTKLAVGLLCGRSGHAAYAASRGGVPAIYVLGGETLGSECASVEYVPLR